MAAKCPKCNTLLLMEVGCADVVCPLCKHAFCWFCGSSINSCLHKMQLIRPDTGLLCAGAYSTTIWLRPFYYLLSPLFCGVIAIIALLISILLVPLLLAFYCILCTFQSISCCSVISFPVLFPIFWALCLVIWVPIAVILMACAAFYAVYAYLPMIVLLLKCK